MSEVIALLPRFGAGVVIGLIFFAGLWLSVQRLTKGRSGAFFMLLSYLLRLAFACAGIYYVADGKIGNLLACLLGFMTVRYLAQVHISRLEAKIAGAKDAP